MATLTPAQPRPPPHHHTSLFLGLQPSAMPPPTSASPLVTMGSFLPPPPKLDKTRLEQLSRMPSAENVSTWRQKVNTPARDALTELSVNVGPPASMNALASGSNWSADKPSASRAAALSRSVPRPPETPDVFIAPGPVGGAATGPFVSRSIYTPVTTASKRAADLTATLASTKRMRYDQALEPGPKGEAHKVEEEKWRQKWLKSFTTLTLHFELGIEEGAGRVLAQRCTALGARVDQFFSNRITHLVVKGVGSPQAIKPSTHKRKPIPDSPMNPFLDHIGPTDLSAKAEAMGKKVWTVKKLTDMLDRLAPMGELSRTASLRTLLEDEKLHGTRERDATAPRPDFYYFKPGSKYLLIEDATGKHRTIMVKEYGYSLKEQPEIPVLHESFLRIPATATSSVPVEEIRERAWSLYVDQKPYKGEQPPGAELRRSTSLRNISGTPSLPESLPYHNASGNSVVITSNIASTSNANFSPAYPGGIPPFAAGKDRSMFNLSKRIQVLKGNASRGMIGMRRPAPLMSAGDFVAPARRASTGQADPILPPKTFMTQEQVVRMLQQAREPAKPTIITKAQRVANREKVEAGLRIKEQDSAPGYCENCRVRYSSLISHTTSRRHRKFAEDNSNFAELDNLLSQLSRPRNPNFHQARYPPCWEPHGKDDPCEACRPPHGWDYQLFADFPGSQEDGVLDEDQDQRDSPLGEESNRSDESTASGDFEVE